MEGEARCSRWARKAARGSRGAPGLRQGLREPHARQIFRDDGDDAGRGRKTLDIEHALAGKVFARQIEMNPVVEELLRVRLQGGADPEPAYLCRCLGHSVREAVTKSELTLLEELEGIADRVATRRADVMTEPRVREILRSVERVSLVALCEYVASIGGAFDHLYGRRRGGPPPGLSWSDEFMRDAARIRFAVRTDDRGKLL